MYDEDLKRAVYSKVRKYQDAFLELQDADSIKQRRLTREMIALAAERTRLELSEQYLPVKRTASVTEDADEGSDVGELSRGTARASCTLSGTKKLVVGTIPAADVIPPYKMWSYLTKSELAQEIGRRMFYTDSTGETVPATDSEDDRSKKTKLDGVYRERDTYVVEHVCTDLGASKEVIKLLASTLKVSIAAVENSRDTDGGIQSPSPQKVPQQFSQLTSNCDKFFCRRCRIYDCLAHQAGHVKPLNKAPPAAMRGDAQPCSKKCWRNMDQRIEPLTTTKKRPREEDNQLDSQVEMLTAQRDKMPRVGDDLEMRCQPLGQQAMASMPDDSRTEKEPARGAETPDGNKGAAACQPHELGAPEEWPVYEKELLKKAEQVFGKNPCSIARMLGTRSCLEIAKIIGTPCIPAGAVQGPSFAGPSHKSAPKRVSAHRKRAKAIVTKRQQNTELLWEAHVPCTCTDGCGPGCSCFVSKHFCGKFCACGPTCQQFFPGCICTGECRSKSCPCQAAGFDCDPDVCKGCTCTALGKDPAQGKQPCANMSLRLRHHKRVALGLSSVAGWGTYLMEPAKKNELIGEYTGELIDQEEADRRGQVYDWEDNSYLFNLNKSWVIDARQRGNKLRFVNHSNEPNCSTKISMVDGDHRVGLYAKQDIPAGAELFFDYQYTLCRKVPSWANA